MNVARDISAPLASFAWIETVGSLSAEGESKTTGKPALFPLVNMTLPGKLADAAGSAVGASESGARPTNHALVSLFGSNVLSGAVLSCSLACHGRPSCLVRCWVRSLTG